MRLAGAFAILVALAGCQREQTFDERFAETSSRLEAKAEAIEKELAVSASDAGEVEVLDSGSADSASGTPRAAER